VIVVHICLQRQAQKKTSNVHPLPASPENVMLAFFLVAAFFASAYVMSASPWLM